MSENNRYPLPEGWSWERIGEIAEVNPTFARDVLQSDAEVSFVPMKRVQEISGHINLSDTRPLEEVRKGYTYFEDGDVIFAKITPCMENGKTAIAQGLKNGVGFGSTEFHVIRVPEAATQQWLFYYLIQEGFRREAKRKMTGSAGQKRVPTSYLKQAALPFPPLDQQRRIVAKIEELFSNLDAGIDHLQTAKKQIERYRMSVLQAAVEGRLTAAWRRTHDMAPAERLLERILEERCARWEEDYRAKYETNGKKPPSGWNKRYTEPKAPDPSGLPELPEGWVWANGDQVFQYVTSGSRGWSKYYADEGQLFLRVGDVSTPDLKIDFSNVQRVGLPEAVRGHRSLLEPNDILISITADIGKVGLVPDEIEEAYINQHVALARPSLGTTAKYLAYFMVSPGGGGKQFRSMQRGATKAGLTLTDIRRLKVALPPKEELYQLVSEVDRLLSVADDAAATVERDLQRAERLRQSILKEAFRGRLGRSRSLASGEAIIQPYDSDEHGTFALEQEVPA